MPWLTKFFEHGNGICLTPDRTSAPWWQQFAPRADLILFVSPKIKFVGPDGNEGRSPAQGTCLIGIGPRSQEPLYRAAAHGLGIVMVPIRRPVNETAASVPGSMTTAARSVLTDQALRCIGRCAVDRSSRIKA